MCSVVQNHTTTVRNRVQTLQACLSEKEFPAVPLRRVKKVNNISTNNRDMKLTEARPCLVVSRLDAEGFLIFLPVCHGNACPVVK